MGCHFDASALLDSGQPVAMMDEADAIANAPLCVTRFGDSLLADRAALRTYWNSVLESPARDAVLELVRVDWLAPDAFVEIQRYEVFDADGKRLLGGYASLLWRKVDGRWLIASDVSNA